VVGKRGRIGAEALDALRGEGGGEGGGGGREGGRGGRGGGGGGGKGLVDGFEGFLGCFVDAFVDLFAAEGVGGASVLEAGSDGFCLSLHVSLEVRAAESTDVFDDLQHLVFDVVLVAFQAPEEEVFDFLAGLVGDEGHLADLSIHIPWGGVILTGSGAG
jgi:hypothetical protein